MLCSKERKRSIYASEETEAIDLANTNRDEVSEGDDARLLANIRPFKRARERFFKDEHNLKENSPSAPEPTRRNAASGARTYADQ